jgi:sulfonate transport system ATP-binding protein
VVAVAHGFEPLKVAPTPPVVARGAGVELHDLTVGYGERRVLEGVTLEVTAGELIAVIGKSGSGKTTLLRALAGLTPHSGGVLRVTHPGETPRVRVMFQEDRLLPWARVLDNVALGLSAEQVAAARGVLAAVGLSKRAREFPHTLSGGQRQRVALARALAHRPNLLLLDEPFGALDAITRGEMQALVEALWLETGITVLLVTHDIDEALRLADRVIVLRDGRISQDLRLNAPRPRRRTHPELLALRDALEEAL